jgi:hypothetical protein
MVDDATLFDWLRYYARVILLLFLLGAGASAALYRAYPPDYTAGTIIVSTGTAIPPRSFGSVAIAVSRSSEVFERASEALGVTERSREFFQDHSEVISVPGSNVMVVAGRARDAQGARRISHEMSRAVADVLKKRTGDQIQVFPRPDRTEALEGFSLPVAVCVGGASGLIAGIALSVALYRQRRPVLSMFRAAFLLGAGEIAIYEANVRARLFWLRRKRVLERTALNLRHSPDYSEDEQLGGRAAKSRERALVAAHAGTPERELILQAFPVDPIPDLDRPQLLWVQ